MRIFWNAGQKEIIKGLDILGLRQIDQEIEKGWVSNITTISFRVRYLSLLPWILAEFYYRELSVSANAAVFDEAANARLAKVLARLEFVVVLASTHGSEWGESGVLTGVLGTDVHDGRLAAFSEVGEADLPEEERSGIYGNYVVPCQGFGLITFSGGIPQITPRGKNLVLARNRALGKQSKLLQLIFDGGKITTSALENEGRHFSVNGLSASQEEQKLLVEAFLIPYTDDPSVVDSYSRLGRTISWAMGLLRVSPAFSQGLIRRAYQYAVTNPSIKLEEVEKAWAEYELRRRVHFSLELLLDVLATVLAEQDHATIPRIIATLAEENELSNTLQEILGVKTVQWGNTIDSLKHGGVADAFLESGVNLRRARSMTVGNRCVFAIALLIASAKQSALLRNSGQIPDRSGYMERVFAILDDYAHRPLFDLIQEVFLHSVIEPHLKTTLRKMAQGQQCSLRFYPEGNSLRSTGMGVAAGHSGDRLGNVLGMLADLGIFSRMKNGFSPAPDAAVSLKSYGVV